MPQSKIKCLCPVCFRELSASVLKRHVFGDVEKHQEIINEVKKRKKEFLQTFVPPKCKTCNKEVKYTLDKLENYLIFQLLDVKIENNNFSFLKTWCSHECFTKHNIPWNKGKTKFDDEKLMKISQDRMGDKNPMFQILNDPEKKQNWLNNLHASGIYERISQENKGKTLEERFGKEAADKMKKTNSEWCKVGRPHLGHKHTQETKDLLREKTIQTMKRTGGKISSPHRQLFDKLEQKFPGEVFLEHNEIYYSIDIAFPVQKIAVEVDGDFWHCNEEKGFFPKYPSQIRNLKNDKRKNSYLTNRDWEVIRIWASEIDEDANLVIDRIMEAYERRKNCQL